MPPVAGQPRKSRALRTLLLLVACAAPVQVLLILAVPPLRHGWPAAVLLAPPIGYLTVITVAARRVSRRVVDPHPGEGAGGSPPAVLDERDWRGVAAREARSGRT